MKSLVAAVLFASLAGRALADEGGAPPPPPRPVAKKPVEPPKFENGKLTDSYWGVVFQLPGLEEKKGDRPAGRLLDARVGRVQIEVSVFEHPDELPASERRDAATKSWVERRPTMKDYVQGNDPAPWATFQEEANSGGMRRHGYAWFARGPRSFVVHSFVMADAEGGADGVKSALSGLTVGPETGASVLAQVEAKKSGRAWDDPQVMLDAGVSYLNDQGGATPLPAIAETVLQSVLQNLPQSAKPEGILTIHEQLAIAKMKLKKWDECIALLNKCVELAAKTDAPGPRGANVDYNMACAYSLQGKVDEAFASLEKAFARAADWGPPVSDDHLRKDADLENCRKDPRWRTFMETKPRKQ